MKLLLTLAALAFSVSSYSDTLHITDYDGTVKKLETSSGNEIYSLNLNRIESLDKDIIIPFSRTVQVNKIEQAVIIIHQDDCKNKSGIMRLLFPPFNENSKFIDTPWNNNLLRDEGSIAMFGVTMACQNSRVKF